MSEAELRVKIAAIIMDHRHEKISAILIADKIMEVGGFAGLRDALTTIANLSDSEMRDGDGAREIARRALASIP